MNLRYVPESFEYKGVILNIPIDDIHPYDVLDRYGFPLDRITDSRLSFRLAATLFQRSMNFTNGIQAVSHLTFMAIWEELTAGSGSCLQIFLHLLPFVPSSALYLILLDDDGLL